MYNLYKAIHNQFTKKPVSIIQQVSLLDESDKSEDEVSIKEDNKKRSGTKKILFIYKIISHMEKKII